MASLKAGTIILMSRGFWLFFLRDVLGMCGCLGGFFELDIKTKGESEETTE